MTTVKETVLQMPTLTHEEAQTFIEAAVAILVQLDESEKSKKHAIPKSIMDVGQACILLSALVALIAKHCPYTVPGVEFASDLATINFRGSH